MAFGNQYGIDMGAIGNAWARDDQNALRQMLGKKQIAQYDREEQNQKALAQYLPGAMQGDTDALGHVTAAKPELGVSLMNRRRTMAREDLDTAIKQAPAILKLFGDANEGNYALRRQAAISAGISGAEKFPPNFDPNFIGGLMESAKPFYSPKFDIKEGEGGFYAFDRENPTAPVQIPGVRPKGRAPIFQDLPMEGDRIQRQMSRDNGQTWEPYGRPYDRREPFIIQKATDDEGNITERAIPRAAITAQLAGAGGTAPAQPSGSTVQPAQQGVSGIPLSVTPPKRTDEQNKAAGYSDRLAQSMGEIDKFEAAGLSLKDRAASSIPVVGNYAVSNEYQQLDQAQRDFINAVLRRESGAVIADPEFDNARKQYFPQPGDSKETLEQKYRNRLAAYEGMKRSAGQGYKPTAEYKRRTPTGAPQPGHTEDGYRFKGGNPADPNSWEKL